MNESNFTCEQLQSILDYAAESGVFTWKVRRGNVLQGRAAGYLRDDGYITIRINRRHYRAHRLAWLWMHGEWPTDDIDHIDGNPANNAIDNLRTVSPGENLQNMRRARSDNNCGLLGVAWQKSCKLWRAQIRVNGQRIHIGYFKDAESAHAAYLAKKREVHPFGMI